MAALKLCLVQCCIKSAGNKIDAYGKWMMRDADAASNGWNSWLMPTKIRFAWCAMLASERKYAWLMPTLASISPVIKMKKWGNDTASPERPGWCSRENQSSIRNSPEMIQPDRRNRERLPDAPVIKMKKFGIDTARNGLTSLLGGGLYSGVVSYVQVCVAFRAFM